MRTHARKYCAEFIGTFALTFTVLLSIGGTSASLTAVFAALTVGLFVYTVGNISGTHLNPAVTLSLLSVKKISLHDAAAYIVVQVLGALLAMFLASQMPIAHIVVTAADSMTVAFAEAIGAFVLVFGISPVVYGKVHSAASGLVIGGSLFLGLRLTDGLSNGVLNPAVAIGIGSVSAVYLLAPVAGGLAAVWCYRFLID